MQDFDVIVIGGGNAGLCAALSAREQGARVALLERAPEELRGGNSAHTGGAFRVAYRGVDDLRQLMPDLLDSEIESSDFGSYTQDDFYGELAAQSQYRADPEVLDTVVSESLDTLGWMTRQGVRFMPIYGRQAFKVDGKYKFWGGLTVEVSGGGLGLVEALMRRAERSGVELHYACRAQRIGRADGRWQVECADGRRFSAGGLILATGGFHANLEWRAKYLGPGWDLAKVRGSRFNTGDGIRMAMDVGAVAHGNWSGCHAVFYDVNAPELGDLDLLNMQKNYFHLGVVVNADGKRFVDEGLDFRNYTYSGMGAKVLQQPGGVAWQLFDQHSEHLLPDEYRVRHATRIQADSLEQLAKLLELPVDEFLAEVAAYNAAVSAGEPPAFGRRHLVHQHGALRSIARPPFYAYPSTAAVFGTYCGVKVDAQMRVHDVFGAPIDSLLAAGEMVGGLHGAAYMTGSALGKAAIFGRLAAATACHG